MHDRSSIMVTLKDVAMNKLSIKERARILACLVLPSA